MLFYKKITQPTPSMWSWILVAGLAIFWTLIQLLKLFKPVKIVETLVVLGSGGHTAEMLRLLDSFSKAHRDNHFIVGADDILSASKLDQLVTSKSNYSVYRILRPRSVGQSYLSSILSSFKSFINCIAVFSEISPKVVRTKISVNYLLTD